MHRITLIALTRAVYLDGNLIEGNWQWGFGEVSRQSLSQCKPLALEIANRAKISTPGLIRLPSVLAICPPNAEITIDAEGRVTHKPLELAQEEIPLPRSAKQL